MCLWESVEESVGESEREYCVERQSVSGRESLGESVCGERICGERVCVRESVVERVW